MDEWTVAIFQDHITQIELRWCSLRAGPFVLLKRQVENVAPAALYWYGPWSLLAAKLLAKRWLLRPSTRYVWSPRSWARGQVKTTTTQHCFVMYNPWRVDQSSPADTRTDTRKQHWTFLCVRACGTHTRWRVGSWKHMRATRTLRARSHLQPRPCLVSQIHP
jgi:hypothetical protein